MTDNEIIKDLKKILELMLCEGDLQRASTISKALDLINRQQAEIDRLLSMNEAKLDMIHDLQTKLETARVEAIKDFAERLIARAEKAYYSDTYMCVDVYDIAKLEEEMVGENNEV